MQVQIEDLGEGIGMKKAKAKSKRATKKKKARKAEKLPAVKKFSKAKKKAKKKKAAAKKRTAVLGCCTLTGSGPDVQIEDITREECRRRAIALGKNNHWVLGKCAEPGLIDPTA